MSAVVRLEWQRDLLGYEIVERSPVVGRTIATSDPGGHDVVARGGRSKHYVLEGTDNRVFLELANTPATPAGVLAFTNKYGLLKLGSKQDLEDFYECINGMNRAVELARTHTHSLDQVERALKKRGVGMRLRFGRLLGDSAPRVILDAEHLLSFCQAQFIQLLDGGIEVRKCPRCGTLLALGKVGQQPTYCSGKCRVAMHRRKKRARAARAASGKVLARNPT